MLEMCSAVMNWTCLEIVLIKQTMFINMMYPASVTLLYLYRMLVGKGKIPPLMSGVFFLGFLLSGIPGFSPNVFCSSDVIIIEWSVEHLHFVLYNVYYMPMDRQGYFVL